MSNIWLDFLKVAESVFWRFFYNIDREEFSAYSLPKLMRVGLNIKLTMCHIPILMKRGGG